MTKSIVHSWDILFSFLMSYFSIIFFQVENKGHEVVFDHLHATAYQHSPLGRTVLGTIEDIEKITNAQVQDYFSSNYAAHRMVCFLPN